MYLTYVTDEVSKSQVVDLFMCEVTLHLIRSSDRSGMIVVVFVVPSGLLPYGLIRTPSGLFTYKSLIVEPAKGEM